MKAENILNARDPDLVASIAAMKRAAAQARKIAIQTGTAIVVKRGQRIVRRTAEELSEDEASSRRVR